MNTAFLCVYLGGMLLGFIMGLVLGRSMEQSKWEREVVSRGHGQMVKDDGDELFVWND